MKPRKVKQFCNVVSQACRDGLLSKQEAKTIIGQAKSGNIAAAMKGVQTAMER